MNSVNKNVHQIPIIYTPLNSNRERKFNIQRCFTSSLQLYQGMQSRDSCVQREQAPALRYCQQQA